MTSSSLGAYCQEIPITLLTELQTFIACCPINIASLRDGLRNRVRNGSGSDRIKMDPRQKPIPGSTHDPVATAPGSDTLRGSADGETDNLAYLQ